MAGVRLRDGALGAATRTRLARYHDAFFTLNEDYPSLWWLVALADQKIRRSHMERIRRGLAVEQLELAGAGLKHDFDPEHPWDVVFRDAAKDRDYWHVEVDRKVVQYTTAQRTRPQLVDPGFGHLRFAGMAGRGSGPAEGSDDRGPGMKRQKKNKKVRKDTRDSRGKEDAVDWWDKGKGKGKGKEKDASGKLLRDREGTQLC